MSTAVDVPPLVEAHDVHVTFGRQDVLRGIDLSIPRGQTLAIIGESGCGKTVFLKTMIGLVRPTSGQMLFDGRNLTKLSERELTRQRVRFGFVFQGAALFDSMTVAQNVGFPLRQQGIDDPDRVHEIVVARLTEVGLPKAILSKKPAELSGGMRKRVGLARALALEPELMLYDEPTTGLDPIMSDVINVLMMRTRDLRRTTEHPVTSVLVTHDMHTAKKVADRIVMFMPLARVAQGEPQIIYDGPAHQIEQAGDQRVLQFIHGEAGERLQEIGMANGHKPGEAGSPPDILFDQQTYD